jgi:hypothetical protein
MSVRIMVDLDENGDCQHRVGGRTCIQSLANGWIGCTDLCSTCTSRFMAALDALGEELDWHAAFIQRAAR